MEEIFVIVFMGDGNELHKILKKRIFFISLS